MDNSITIKRVFPISPSRLFEIWTKKELIQDWHRPNKKEYKTEAESDDRQGGAFRISMKHKNGDVHTSYGIYTEFNPPNSVRYSWQWENDPTEEKSEVYVQFNPIEGGTELVLTHSRLDSPESAQRHKDGWEGCLVNLDEITKITKK